MAIWRYGDMVRYSAAVVCAVYIMAVPGGVLWCGGMGGARAASDDSRAGNPGGTGNPGCIGNSCRQQLSAIAVGEAIGH